MGLDSVELIMEIENYFGVQISDIEAEKIGTVQEAVDCVSKHLKITSTSTSLQDNIFTRIQNALPSQLSLNDNIFTILDPNNSDSWKEFCNSLGLEVPKPYMGEQSGLMSKILSKISLTPNYKWKELSVDQFVNSICAANYKKLIDNRNIKSSYEVYIAIKAITVDKLGIDYYEVLPEKSFANDFGAD